MNFKFQEFKDVLLNRQGLIPIAINFGLQMGISLLVFIPLFFVMMAIGISDPYAMESGEMDVVLVLIMLLMFVIFLPLMVYIQAATYGSLKDCIEQGSMLGAKRFFSNGLKYFLPVLGYGLLLGFIIGIVAIPVVFVSLGFTIISETLGMILYFLALAVITVGAFLLSPLVYLSVVEGNPFSHLKTLLKKHWKELVVAAIVLVVINFVPFLNIIASFVALLFPLYALVLFYDFPKEEEIITETTLEKNTMEVIEEIQFVEIKEEEEKKEDE